MDKRFLIIGGKIPNTNTYLSAEAICALYKLNPKECVLVNPEDKTHDYFRLTKSEWDKKYGKLTELTVDPVGKYQLSRGAR